MDGGAQSGPPSFSSFVMFLEDMRSRKDLAEDWLGNNGILIFSGLFSAMIIVFIIGGNEKMQCNTIAENVLWMAETSNGLISMLNGTHHEGTLAPPAMATATATATTSSFVPYRPKVSLLINVIWTTSLTFSLASTVFGIMVRRWAVRYLVNNLHRPIHTRIRHIQSRARKHVDMSPPLALVSRIHLFLPLSVALFYLGLVIFMVHIGISFTLVFVSSFVFTWVIIYEM